MIVASAGHGTDKRLRLTMEGEGERRRAWGSGEAEKVFQFEAISLHNAGVWMACIQIIEYGSPEVEWAALWSDPRPGLPIVVNLERKSVHVCVYIYVCVFEISGKGWFW